MLDLQRLGRVLMESLSVGAMCHTDVLPDMKDK